MTLDYTDAACRSPEVDPEVFFNLDRDDEPDTGIRRRENKRREKAARKVCGGCPIREACLLDNLDVPEGIFGGKGPLDRRRMRGGEAPHIDMIAVERAVNGEELPLTRRERDVVLRELEARSVARQEIARVLGILPASVNKAQKRLGLRYAS